MQVRRLFALVCVVVAGVCLSVNWFLAAADERDAGSTRRGSAAVAEAECGLNCPILNGAFERLRTPAAGERLEGVEQGTRSRS